MNHSSAPRGGALLSCFEASGRRSIKISSYFPVYESLLSRYRDQAITIVEVGVLGGGSLEMWRRFLGCRARIIGIDFNPDAKRLELEGYEIYVGNQADPRFWRSAFAQIGSIDVLIDDGGHTTLQQVTTVVESLRYIRDGGLLIVEDVHSSFMAQFGNPSRASFTSLVTRWSDAIHERFFREPNPSEFAAMVHSVEVFESMVVFKIDRALCRRPVRLVNRGGEIGPADLRNASQRSRRFFNIGHKLAGLLPRSVQSVLKRRAVAMMEHVMGERALAKRRVRESLRQDERVRS